MSTLPMALGRLGARQSDLGGALFWQYRTFTYNGGISLREVQSRGMQSVPNGPTNTWTWYHDDSYDASLTYHIWTDIYDSGANTQKVYWPGVVNSSAGIVGQSGYEERNTSGAATFDKWLGYTTDSAGNTYVNSAQTTLDAGSSSAIQTTTYQTLDIYGNLTQQQVYDYGAASPTRTYNFTYITDPNYISRYIRNRFTLATVTTSSVNNFQLASIGYDSGTLTDAGTVPMHDPSYNTSFTYRGNPTSKWSLSSSSSMTYQTTGVVNQVSSNGVTVSTSTDTSTGYSLPAIITPNGTSSLATTMTYNSSWAVTSVTGANGANSATGYDSYGRPLSSKGPDGAVTSYSYTYAPGASTQTASLYNQWKTTTLDGFGRPTKVVTGHDQLPPVSEVDTLYGACACSPLGKMTQVTLPYAYGGTPLPTKYTYDGSGRILTITKADGSVTQYSYAGNTTTETDPAGKWKTFTKDAFGNLTIVTEPDPANQPSGVVYTYYTYDQANRLTQVSMPRAGQPQIRTFTWNGSDLITATNPENGTVTYGYDANHRVVDRYDAKQQETRYTYDSYGRLTRTRHYTPTWGSDPADQIDYYYDSQITTTYNASNLWGRLSGVVWGGAGYAGNYSGPDMWYEFNYNQAGRVTGKRMSIPGDNNSVTTHDGTWTWDDRGRTTAMSIDDDSYSYTFDNMSNLTGMTGTNGITEQATYNWAGQRLTLNGETRTYNNLMQLTRIQNGGLDDEYIYKAGQNNGRIIKLIDHVRGETIDYTYDSLNRLTMAEQESGQWGNAFAYDGWGNMTGQTFTPGQAATPTPNFQPGRDGNGNIATGAFLTFDVENRLISAGTASYALTTYGYDPWGKRVKTCCTTDQYGNHNPTYYFYGVDGRRLMTYAPYTNGLRDVYFGGTKVIAGGSGVSVDRLGSVRNNVNGSIAYYPYGQERTSTPDGLDKFGTYTRDGSLGGFLQDYADQRYYAANVGAFWSADPAGLASADPKNPTTWNGYLYGNADPVSQGDASGRIAYFTDNCGPDWMTDASLSGPCPGDPAYDSLGGGTDCYGTYFSPVPNPACYAPVPVILSQSDDDEEDAVKCVYTGATILKPGFGAGVSIGYGYHMPLYLNFAATGGDGTYNWSDTQQYSEVGSVVYSSSPIPVPINDSGTESLTNYGQPDSTTKSTGNLSPYASFYDAPGQTSNDPAYGKTVAADLRWTFTLNVSVNGVACDHPVQWSATLKWLRKRKPRGSDKAPNP